MARYYNKSRGPLALTLRDGRCTVARPKEWIEIEPRDEGSSSVIFYRRKGVLHRAPDSSEAPVEASPPEVPEPGVPQPTESVKAEPEPEPEEMEG
jgi:hypothetical protein